MGLDMYLKARRYICRYFGGGEELMNKIKSNFPEIQKITAEDNSVEVIFTIGYWRKANQIHNWFVEKVQDGVDDCKDYYVSREQLKELRRLCLETISVLDEATKKKVKQRVGINSEEDIYEDVEVYFVDEDDIPLKTISGLFFGGTEYDEWYYRKLKHTINIIDNALSLSKDYEFNYQSSW